MLDVAELAKKHKVSPNQITVALAELGVDVENGKFQADDDVVELVLDSIQDSGEAGKTLFLEPGRTARDLASALGVADKEVQMLVIKEFKVMATLTTPLADDLSEKVADKFGYSIKWGAVTPKKPASAAKKVSVGAVPRPPVVTILGHVDHGKTSLLDYIRKTSVANKEHGGITQHIGAYQVKLPEGVITFLDTPGHAAFTAMRARGAQVTDIAILVVAADDGIMPQTIEAINHAQSADVPIIIAINKIDKADANVDKVMQSLTNHQLVPEAYGGQTIVCPVSAHTGEGVPHLLEMILLQAEVLEKKADPRGDLEGVVIEAKLEKGRGPVATVLVEEGTLKVGDSVVVGNTWGKIKAMTDYTGERLKEAGPSVPAEILGLGEVPQAGDRMERYPSEKEARATAESRSEEARAKALSKPARKISLRDVQQQLTEDTTRDLNLIVKADVQGSVEAVKGLIDKIDNDEINVKIVHAGVGSITESDILLATASNAICVGFNVKPEPKAKTDASIHGIEIRTYTVIYELIEDIEAAVKGMLEPKFAEEYHGTVEIRASFKLTKSGKVAGCHCTDGKILRNDKVRVKRDGELVFEGDLDSLRNVKQDVREIIAGQDCGIKFEGWEDFAVGDIIESYTIIQVG